MAAIEAVILPYHLVGGGLLRAISLYQSDIFAVGGELQLCKGARGKGLCRSRNGIDHQELLLGASVIAQIAAAAAYRYGQSASGRPVPSLPHRPFGWPVQRQPAIGSFIALRQDQQPIVRKPAMDGVETVMERRIGPPLNSARSKQHDAEAKCPILQPRDRNPFPRRRKPKKDGAGLAVIEQRSCRSASMEVDDEGARAQNLPER
ncbi:hypothetical protein IH86_01730 [Sphingobium yanoikuyae]|nr:hypothetical protein IH86_01730 [Sphingobium yanoikuyae]